jgi:hypothetical protein
MCRECHAAAQAGQDLSGLKESPDEAAAEVPHVSPAKLRFIHDKLQFLRGDEFPVDQDDYF